MRAALRRVPVARAARPRSKSKTYPAPIGGWVTNENLAEGNARAARVMDNAFPEYEGVRFRAGSVKSATIGSDRVEALFRYQQGGVEKLFAASDSDIYDVSALNPSSAPSADVSSQTSGYYSTAQIATSGGEFLYVCNEADSPQLYDGSSWTQITNVSSPAITGTTSSDTSLLRAVWSYRNRLIFVERDSLNAWALPTESVGGAAIQISLAGVFKKGGAILFGGTWSLDSGDGVDDKCVFVSDEGEVAIYEGGDPSDPTNWNLVGVYATSEPLGKNAWVNIGGDFLIGTVAGIVPITEIIRKDASQTAISAITARIEPNWKEEAGSRSSTYPWEMMTWPEQNMLLCSLPHSATQAFTKAFVRNTETGAWARYVGWDIQCMSMFGATAYFGDSDGSVIAMESTGTDDGASYVVKIAYAWDALGAPNFHKDATLARASFKGPNPINVCLEVHTDYINNFGAATDAADDGEGSAVWDTAVWDTDAWDGGSAASDAAILRSTRWMGVAGPGMSHAPALQSTIGNTEAPNALLLTFDLVWHPGGLVV